MFNDKGTIPLILLAAGESKRMGTPKQLLAYKDSNFIRHAATEAIKSSCQPVVVILGANSDRIVPALKDLPVEVVLNTYWQQGMSSSIAAGINALLTNNVDFSAVVIALGDQPLVTAKTYNLLRERYQKYLVNAVASKYSNTLGVPALFSRNLVSQLLKTNQSGGAKQLLNQYSDRTLNLDVPEAAIDIDTPADYQKLLKI